MKKVVHDFIKLSGQSQWTLQESTGINFKAGDWHAKVRLEFTYNMPSDFSCYFDLSPSEARAMASQLMNAAADAANEDIWSENKVKRKKGDGGQ